MMDTDQRARSTLANDIAVLWPYFLGTALLAGFLAFLFYVFSGRVDLKDATVSALVGATITQVINILAVVFAHYFREGREARAAMRGSES